jgi:hypothetical protein
MDIISIQSLVGVKLLIYPRCRPELWDSSHLELPTKKLELSIVGFFGE